MDVVKAVETYITKLVSTPSAMKVLLLDTHTVHLLYTTVQSFKLHICNRRHPLFHSRLPNLPYFHIRFT